MSMYDYVYKSQFTNLYNLLRDHSMSPDHQLLHLLYKNHIDTPLLRNIHLRVKQEYWVIKNSLILPKLLG